MSPPSPPPETPGNPHALATGLLELHIALSPAAEVPVSAVWQLWVAGLLFPTVKNAPSGANSLPGTVPGIRGGLAQLV